MIQKALHISERSYLTKFCLQFGEGSVEICREQRVFIESIQKKKQSKKGVGRGVQWMCLGQEDGSLRAQV